MNKLFKQALALAAAVMCSVASAGVVTFEGAAPAIYAGGDTLTEGDVTMTVLGSSNNFSGALADSNGCLVAACPLGNDGLFFAGLNDAGMNLAFSNGISIGVRSLDFGFLSPVPIADLSGFGMLVLQGLMADGSSIISTREFSASDSDGNFFFSHWDISDALSTSQFSSINIMACLFNGNGDCVNPADNQAQFAVDNIAYVPEPATLALVGLSLFGLAATRRRQSV